MTSQAITRINIYSQPSINIFNTINTRANVTDPRDNAGNRKFVYNSDPFEKAMDFSGVPYIVCKYAELEPPLRKSADGKKQGLRWVQTIIVRTKKNGSSGISTDTGITDMNKIVDDIIETFNSATVKGTLRGYDQYDVNINVIDVDDILINQDILFQTTLEVSYSTRLQVSA